MSKILAIDFGLKRTGLAISDESKMFAFGLDTVDSKDLMNKLKQLVKDEKVNQIVLGYPKRLDNSDSHVTKNVELLAEAIRAEIPTVGVELLDERFTSKLASQAMHTAGASKKQKKEKGLIDKVSATVLLQDYLQR